MVSGSAFAALIVSEKVRVALSVAAVRVTEQVVVFFEFRHEVKFIVSASILWQARASERGADLAIHPGGVRGVDLRQVASSPGC